MNKFFKKLFILTLAVCMALCGGLLSVFGCSIAPTDGKDGKNGKNGKDGVSVESAEINLDGNLIITLTDGTKINCGKVPEGTAGGDTDDDASTDDSSNPDTDGGSDLGNG